MQIEKIRKIVTLGDEYQKRFLFRFNPQSKWIFLYQKILDSFALGLAVVLFYEIIKILFIDKLKT